MFRVRVYRVEPQRIAWIEWMAEVGLGDPRQVEVCVLCLRVGQRQRLGTGNRVVARAAVQPVVPQATEDDVVVLALERSLVGRRLTSRRLPRRIDAERRQVD